MLEEIYNTTRDHMQKSLDVMKKEFNTLRTGKVSTSILDGIKVDYYDTPTPLSQVATVMAKDATTIAITPWEKPMIKEIERAIQQADIGVNPNSDDEGVKLFFPPMTSEQRKEVAKQAKAVGEKTKVAVRNVRKDGNDKVKKLEKDKEVSEDEAKGGLDQIQKITDEMIKKIDDAVKVKEEEILKV